MCRVVNQVRNHRHIPQLNHLGNHQVNRLCNQVWCHPHSLLLSRALCRLRNQHLCQLSSRLLSQVSDRVASLLPNHLRSRVRLHRCNRPRSHQVNPPVIRRVSQLLRLVVNQRCSLRRRLRPSHLLNHLRSPQCNPVLCLRVNHRISPLRGLRCSPAASLVCNRLVIQVVSPVVSQRRSPAACLPPSRLRCHLLSQVISRAAGQPINQVLSLPHSLACNPPRSLPPNQAMFLRPCLQANLPCSPAPSPVRNPLSHRASQVRSHLLSPR